MNKLHTLTAAQGASAAGDAITTVTLLLALQERGASAFVVSALVLAELLPSVVLGPVLAPLLDRMDVSRIVSAALALRALIAIGIAFVPSEGGLLLLVAAAAAVSAVDSPAMALLVPTTVPAGRAVAVGYARSDTCRTIGALVGPAVAGFLVAAVGTRATLLVDAGTFLLLLTIVLALRLRRPPERTPVTRTPWLRQVVAGPRSLFGDRVMAASVLALASAIVFTAMITVAEVFFIRQELGQPAAVYGVLVTTGALGRLTAAALVAPRIPPRRQQAALWSGGVLMGTGLLVMAWVPSVASTAGGLFLVGAANAVQSLAIRSIVHARAPRDVQGRAFAAMIGTNNAATMAGTAVGGPAVALLGGGGTLLLGGVGTLLATLVGTGWLLRREQTS